MSDQPNPSSQPNPGQSREVNLQAMANQFMAGMQRHFDMLAFNLASRENTTEEGYLRHSRAPRAMPAAAVHQNFEQMQAHARDLLFCQVVNDSLNLAVTCLNNVHLFLALAKANAEHGGLPPEAQQKAQQAQQTFLQAQLDKKFNLLEENYGVMCELEDTLTSLGFVMQALIRQGGIVKAAQLDSNKELVLELKTIKDDGSSEDIWRNPNRFETATKVFREDEKIEFSDAELQSILLTIAVFAHQAFTAAFRFARERQAGS